MISKYYFLLLLLVFIPSVSALPVFSNNDLIISMVNGESVSESVIIYDVDMIDIDKVVVFVKPHPDYVDVPTFIKNIVLTRVDDYAVRVSFDVVESVIHSSFHRELLVLNNNQILNVAIYNDNLLVGSVKDFFGSKIKIFGVYFYSSLVSLFVFSMLVVGYIIFFYKRYS